MLKPGDIIRYENSGNIFLILENNKGSYLNVRNGKMKKLETSSIGDAEHKRLCNIIDLIEKVEKELK